ncbi:hypothetical protein F441_02160 [Phytophthora nicotianae CJ01A1]|uniref:Uncharacterized protein n=6 Tax=Phytophthora nicotianae TaxID=4792 RepID=W2QR58_PHYN3|nr:hypothetical protein PPTG_22005 [Phytophthora nicotianae INRA-310]ETI55107.1 hypothetical protein F443_02191 [Phytophthora nicotianae P1569]ETK94933.1 hypothetical protein L915_02099 [Phytophthora nicotianae]ETO83853.1 hypothetical protein F444_02193 [Phytophthora nicotianae P1976]ETP24922.1 hypothetical protein F441_02160 [Phytophthora nicotianae CJ01A1]ETP52913.1 hypothetical protein F442_02145 [Phytophthora nicotianae P10297]
MIQLAGRVAGMDAGLHIAQLDLNLLVQQLWSHDQDSTDAEAQVNA